MNPLETQLVIYALVAIPIVLGLTWALSSIVMVKLGDATWDQVKKSHKYRHILK